MGVNCWSQLVRGLTSRVCIASRSFHEEIAPHADRSHPGFRAGFGIAAGARARPHPMPGDNRHK
ncbi:hypothetical protein MAHJHV64_44870 [Mycobacterium avium subsp. hominissuis]